MDDILFTEEQIQKYIDIVADQILDARLDLNKVVLIGVLPRGIHIAQRLAKAIYDQKGIKLPCGKIEVTLFRDDIASQQFVTVDETDIPFSTQDKIVIIVNDHLFEGRGIRAALSTLAEFDLPHSVKLAVLFDRGHRKVPIQADYVADTITTNEADELTIKLFEIDGEDLITIRKVS